MLLSARQLLRSTFILVFPVVAAAIAVAQSSPSESERDAYEAAIHHKQVQPRVNHLELFLKNFPNSTLKERALESLADGYSQLGNAMEQQETVERLLRVNGGNLRGLTLKAYLMLLGCDSGDCEKQQAALAEHGFRVLRAAIKPDYLSDAEFDREKAQAESLFHRLAGFTALMQHDYGNAQTHLLVLVEAEPNSLDYVYPLALTYLNGSPPDVSKGLFFMARTAILAPASARPEIEKFGRGQYAKYHGSLDGWQDVLRIAKANPRLPSGFTITPAR